MTYLEWLYTVLAVLVVPPVLALPWAFLLHLRGQLVESLGDQTEEEWCREQAWGMLAQRLAEEGQEILEAERTHRHEEE